MVGSLEVCRQTWCWRQLRVPHLDWQAASREGEAGTLGPTWASETLKPTPSSDVFPPVRPHLPIVPLPMSIWWLFPFKSPEAYVATRVPVPKINQQNQNQTKNLRCYFVECGPRRNYGLVSQRNQGQMTGSENTCDRVLAPFNTPHLYPLP